MPSHHNGGGSRARDVIYHDMVKPTPQTNQGFMMPSSDLGFHTRDQGAPNHLRGVPTPVGQQPRWLQISITISAELHRGKCHLDWQNSPSMRRGHGRLKLE